MIRWVRRLIVLGLIVFAVTLAAVVIQANRMQARHGEGRSVEGVHDAALVLGAGIEPDGLIAYTGRRRVHAGVALLNAGKVSRIILSDGSGADGPKRGAQDMADYAVSLGAPRSALLLEAESTSTFANIRFSKALAAEHGLSRVVLITDAVHLTRAKLLAEYLGLGVSGLVAAEARAGQGPFTTWPYYTREAMAWWYNLLKIAAWSGLDAAGWTEQDRTSLVN